jgi:hypothetical protein
MGAVEDAREWSACAADPHSEEEEEHPEEQQ